MYYRLAGGVRFSGNYASWEDARAHSLGYDSPEILDRVKQAMFRVKSGEAVYERDSVLFDTPQYSWPIIAWLLWIASLRDNRLNIVDYGGSLGTTYFQTNPFLTHLRECRWNIVEQRSFVEAGKLHFEDDRLRFHESLDTCLEREHPNALLLSSVLQYLPRPQEFIEDISQRGFEFILLDRTPFSLTGDDRLTVQKVPASIYPASYPAWILNFDRFHARMLSDYELIADYESTDTANIPVVFKGLIYRRRRHA
jgi:putative methyltransferase (TIGR04325 family)